ncbi:hypothetical protein HPB48_012011 [Haemaphysalis longicornis]|uniref:Uncharacterized protein n=1 Tax=Haemaphysalis longicornis TaxID=44386 RepID=A0A9J6G8R6_HAELO|nr:hypothetical protein HPB48_012011 [Haemaphysalis longicornis]
MRGNLKQADNVCKGVITVANNEATESLQQKIKWRAGEIVDIRKYGTSNSAQLTFAGKSVPQYVHYNSEIASSKNIRRFQPSKTSRDHFCCRDDTQSSTILVGGQCHNALPEDVSGLGCCKKNFNARGVRLPTSCRMALALILNNLSLMS